jgi:arginine N-succinyltransferase
VLEVGQGGKQKMLLATGKLRKFVACGALVKKVPRKGLCIDAEAAELLGVEPGDEVLAVDR